jgi:glycerol kinase
MRLVLALDAGTTGVRAVAFNEKAQEVDTAYRELTQFFPAPGWVEHDPQEIVTLAVATLSELAQRRRDAGDEVVAIGITNQRETTIAFDRATGVAHERAIVWQDRRTAAFCAQLDVEGHLDAVRATTGLVLDSYFSGTKMRWLVDHGATAAMQQPAVATVDTYVIFALTGGPRGGEFVTEPSNASRTMLLDIGDGTWSSEMSSMLGVDRSLLASLRPSVGEFGAISGAVIPALAGVPITAVLGDQQAALFGQACFAPGMVKATYGTGAFILANAGHAPPPVADGLLGTIAWDLGDGQLTYALEGSAFVAGAAIQWLRDELGFVAHASDLEALARTVEDAGGVSVVPAFTGLGSPFWRPDARGAVLGLTRGTTRAHVARATVDALAHQVRAMTDAFGAAGAAVTELRADGGAAAMNLLMDLQATGSRCRVRRSASLEATARGAATAAGLGVGLWSMDELVALWSATYDAQPGEPASVDASYAAWCRAVDRA